MTDERALKEYALREYAALIEEALAAKRTGEVTDHQCVNLIDRAATALRDRLLGAGHKEMITAQSYPRMLSPGMSGAFHQVLPDGGMLLFAQPLHPDVKVAVDVDHYIAARDLLGPRKYWLYVPVPPQGTIRVVMSLSSSASGPLPIELAACAYIFRTYRPGGHVVPRIE